MIYRIDRRHFITHAIDYFSYEELINFHYAVISASVSNCGKIETVTKIPHLYPDTDSILEYNETENKEMFERSYFAFLEPDKDDKEKMKRGHPYHIYNIIYLNFVAKLMKHQNVMIVCDENENVYIDALCKYLKKKFKIDVIDLNELFTKGHIGPIYIDRDEINDNCVEIKRSCAREKFYEKAQTVDGRAELISTMKKKDKIKKLKDLGIDPVGDDLKNIDKILLSAWNDEVEDENN